MLRATGSDATVTTGNYIDGVARPAEGGRTYALYNPARPDELVGHAALSSVGDVDAAVRAAHAAYPAWSATSYAERAAKLNEVADYLKAGQDDVDKRARCSAVSMASPLRKHISRCPALGTGSVQQRPMLIVWRVTKPSMARLLIPSSPASHAAWQR